MDGDARRGTAVRLLYLLLAGAWWVAARVLVRFGRRNPGVVVLYYHAVKPRHRDRFAWQMSRIARTAVSPANFTGAGNHRRRTPRVCVTFDDAYVGLIENALPVLARFHIPAVIFPVVANVGDIPRWNGQGPPVDRTERLMTIEELRRVEAAGLCRIGSHSLRHDDLTTLSADRLREEMEASKSALESQLGCAVEDFAVPYGSYNPAVLAAAWSAGYKRIFTSDPHVVNPMQSTPVVGRFPMSPETWRIEFRLTCAGAYRWRGSLRNLVRKWKRRLARPGGAKADE